MVERTGVDINQGTMGEHSLAGHGPVAFAKRPVRFRMQGVVGRGREKLPLTRLASRYQTDFLKSNIRLFSINYFKNTVHTSFSNVQPLH